MKPLCMQIRDRKYIHKDEKGDEDHEGASNSEFNNHIEMDTF